MQRSIGRGLAMGPKAPFILVLGGGIITVLAVLALLFSSVRTMAAKTDEMAAVRDRHAAETLVDISLNRLKTFTDDMNQTGNPGGPMAGPGGPMAGPPPELRDRGPAEPPASPKAFNEDLPADSFLAFDNGFQLIGGNYRDQPLSPEARTAWQQALAPYVAASARAVAAGHPVPAAFVRTPQGLAMVAMACQRAPGATTYLVMTRHMTPALLHTLAVTFRTSALTVEDAPPAQGAFVPLHDLFGNRLAVLAWPDARPGDQAARAVWPQMINVGLLMGVLVLLLVGTCMNGLKRASQGEKTARTQALTDTLSGLPNRRALLDAIARQARRQRLDQTVAFIDLDGFKDVNDLYGHEAGDELIVAVAKALTARLPRGAMLARLGGDEFAVLAGDSRGLEACRAFARAALDFLAQPVVLSNATVRIGASIGIAHSPAGEHSAQELFRRADLAMYNAKQAGKGRVVEYDGAIDTARAERQQIEAEIRCGLINGEFDVAYQPICRAGTHEVEAVEALARWPRRPDGELGPDAFIGAADSSGTIHRLGLFVLKKACSDLADAGSVRLHVNISPVQFRHPEFEVNLKATLDETGFPAHRLELEITERHILENPERARTLIASLAAKGIGFALDDFGAGVSGIGHLQRFGLRRVKIDRALVATIGHDPKAGSLLTGAVSIAHALSLGVVAEGVETEDQEKLLRLVGCDLLQGYRFGRPAPFADIVGRLPGAQLAQSA